MSQYFEGVGRLYLNHIKDFKIPITSFSALEVYGMAQGHSAGILELSADFYAVSDNIVYLKSLLPEKDKYKEVNGKIYVGVNQALLDAMYNEVDCSRLDEAVEDFYFEGMLDSFVEYARKAGLPEKDLKWGIQRALDLGYELKERGNNESINSRF